MMQKAFCLALLIMASAFSGGCYVKQDTAGKWWGCEEYQTPNGPATACAPLESLY